MRGNAAARTWRKACYLALSLSILCHGYPGCSVADAAGRIVYKAAVGSNSVMRGILSHATLIDPADPLPLTTGTGAFSNARAHDATHVATFLHTTTDLLTAATDNLLRIEADGALVEGARTNLVLYSEDFSNAAWLEAYDATKGGSAPVLDPAGDNNAWLLTLGPTGGDFPTAGAIYQQRSGTSGTVYTFSAWLRSVSGTTSARVGWSCGTAYDSGDVALTTAWTRIAVTGTATATAAAFPSIRTNVAGTSDNVYVYGAHFEVGGFASSYLPTTSAAISRTADVLTLPTSGNIDNSAGTVSFTWTPLWGSTGAVGSPVLFDAGGLKATFTAADDKINFTDGTNTVSTAAQTFSANVSQGLAFRWGASGLSVHIDGVEAATGASFTEPALNANLYLGADVSGTNQAFSHFRSFRAWGRFLSDSEASSVSATQ